MTCTSFDCKVHEVGREKKVFDKHVVDSRSDRESRPDSHVSRILQEQEKFMAQQQDLLQAFLQKFITEQAELRSSLDKHYQQVMSLFEPGSVLGSKVSTSDHAALLANEAPPPAPQVERFSGRKKESRMSDRPVHPNKVEFLDFSSLPHDWPTHHHHDTSKRNSVRNPNSLFSRARHFVKGPVLDMVMCLVIGVNVIFMLIQIQWRSYYLAVLLGKSNNDYGWQDHEPMFERIEFVFCTVYLVEFLVRVYLLRRSYLKSWLNIFDGLVVITSAVQTYILQPAGVMKEGSNFSIARLLRLVRVARILKVVRFAQSCQDLRIMLRTLIASARSLAWSMILISGIVLISGILMFQFLVSYIEDESSPRATREWVFDHFGGSLLSTLVMFECTFSTAWVAYSRRLIKEVNPYLSVFWGVYVVLVNFAVMRIVSALFLKETMSVAAVDAEKMAMAKQREKQHIAESIKRIFEQADTSGDGSISVPEFRQMIQNPDVGECFDKLELEVLEVATLFQMLVSDDGVADYEEFLAGALKLKNSARTIDIIQILHEHMRLMKVVEDVCLVVGQLATQSGVRPLALNNGHLFAPELMQS